MKKNLLFLLIIFCSIVTAQNKTNAWTEVNSIKKNESVTIIKPILPVKFKVFEFNYDEFIKQLTNVPQRDTFFGKSNVIISIPHPNGTIEQYRILEASTFEPELQAAYPEIRSFAGQGVDDPSNTLRFSISPYNGISAIVRSASEETTFIIDPFTSDYKNFIIYDKKYSGANSDFKCSTEETSIREFGPTLKNNENQILNNADDGTLRRFRLALSCTGEYAVYHGGTLAAVNAAFNATMTRVNGIFEMDFNTTMVIVATNNNVVYLNAGSDPYSTSGSYNTEVQATITAQIGAANYDIGHLVAANGNNGNAGCIGCICGTAKGSGFTTCVTPIGDNFDIDFVAHEMGHQYGGNHTFTFSTENNAVNVEPGSGITVMGYAGITGATDVAPHSVPFFHAASIQQITNNIKTKVCQVNVATGNAIPVPVAVATKTLPKGTAFKLIGTATDVNASDLLSYCWEQNNDSGTVGTAASTYPSATTSTVNFRSFMPKANGIRMIPNLQDHITNGLNGNKWEIIPAPTAANRVVNFRLTVRDNRPGGGNNESVNTAVTFDFTKGPFTISTQNVAGINYVQGSIQIVSWTVNGTNTMTGSANVNIKLSTDGGYTYPITILANTPNDGTENITIPNVFAANCRILIEPTGNDFYAINTTNFAIGYAVTQTCTSYTVTPNFTIPESEVTVDVPITVNDSYTISDINVTTAITHPRRSQLRVTLRKATQSVYDERFLFKGGACGNAITNLNGTFDDESVTAAGCGATNNFGNMKPYDLMTTFDGLNSQGVWYLGIRDATVDANDGVLNSYTLNICRNTLVETPVACGTITTTWNGTAWSNGAPVRNVAVTFAGNYSSTSDIEACSVTIATGATVTFNAGHTLVVGGAVSVNGTGSLVINNNAALRQIDEAAINTGNIIVKRNSAPMVRLDYTAWSSPVSGQQLQAFSPNTLATRFYQYLYTGTTTPTAYQAVSATTNFAAGKGYMIRAANDWPLTATTFNGQYSGVPLNGNFTISVGRGYNLLGNPYASPIDGAKFINDNSSAIGTLYFWTHTAPASGGVYPTNNYASYTLLGGTASASGGAVPNGTIQTGQGFFVRTFDFSAANFKNSQRVNASVSTQFFRNAENVATTSESDKHRIWLNLNDTENNYNQILVGYVNGATNGIDNTIDGEVLDKSKTMLYNLIDDSEYVIQGKGLPFADTDEIALGLKATTAGTYSISLENVDGLFANQDVYIKDNVTNIVHDIKQTPYSFSTIDGVFNDRFKIVFANSALSNETFVSDESIVVFTQNEELKINASQEIATVEVFDMLGRNIYNNSKVNDKTLNISSIANRNQALLVKITLTSGQSVAKKVIK
ncbi:MAG: zinc-dependent metalloprotease family protein [Bacteroidota bacterium]